MRYGRFSGQANREASKLLIIDFFSEYIELLKIEFCKEYEALLKLKILLSSKPDGEKN